VRNYTKWDNQPGSVTAAMEALVRAAQIAQTAPRGPVYVNLDTTIQEENIGPMPALPDVTRHAVPQAVQPAPELTAAAAQLLSQAKNPVMLVGRVSRDQGESPVTSSTVQRHTSVCATSAHAGRHDCRRSRVLPSRARQRLTSGCTCQRRPSQLGVGWVDLKTPSR